MKRRERTTRGRVGMIRERRQEVGIWRRDLKREGDVWGCYKNLLAKEITFSLNTEQSPTITFSHLTTKIQGTQSGISPMNFRKIQLITVPTKQ